MIHIIFKFIFLFSVVLFLTLHCNSSKVEKNQTKKKDTSKINYNFYFPVSEDYEWEYIVENPEEETQNYKIRITDVRYEKDYVYVIFDSFPFFLKKEQSAEIKVYKNGSVFILENIETGDRKESKFIPESSNLSVNYSWSFAEWNAIISSTNEQVKTKDKTYNNCIKINFALSITFSTEIWLAKDIGIVKWGCNRTNPPAIKLSYYVLSKTNIKN